MGWRSGTVSVIIKDGEGWGRRGDADAFARKPKHSVVASRIFIMVILVGQIKPKRPESPKPVTAKAG